ncbi:MAG: hypothetical protein ACOYBY_16850 [Dermatophilaceae bacterium]
MFSMFAVSPKPVDTLSCANRPEDRIGWLKPCTIHPPTGTTTALADGDCSNAAETFRRGGVADDVVVEMSSVDTTEHPEQVASDSALRAPLARVKQRRIAKASLG